MFDAAVHYRVSPLSAAAAEDWSKTAHCPFASEKESLTRAMDDWYGRGKPAVFRSYAELEATNAHWPVLIPATNGFGSTPHGH